MDQTLNLMFDAAGRALGAASQRYDTKIARRLGLNANDYRCLDLLTEHGPMLAGRLAELTGYTTGAVTGIVSRLERAGFARRVADERDLRRVVVHVDRDGVETKRWPLMAPMAERLERLHRSYSQEQRDLLLDYMRQLETILSQEADSL